MKKKQHFFEMSTPANVPRIRVYYYRYVYLLLFSFAKRSTTVDIFFRIQVSKNSSMRKLNKNNIK